MSELDLFEAEASMSLICGGTFSSSRLRSALEFKKTLKKKKDIWRIDLVIDAWSKALVVHNRQGFIEYNVETGKPKGKKK